MDNRRIGVPDGSAMIHWDGRGVIQNHQPKMLQLEYAERRQLCYILRGAALRKVAYVRSMRRP